MIHSERGNVALSCGPSAVFWVIENNNAVKEVSYTPDNYPAWCLDDNCSLTVETLVKHINENLQGWFVHKANVDGINIDESGTVAEE